jgi:DNA repair photolyase
MLAIKNPRQLENRKITSGTKEWADYNVNCIKGCYNDCRYCYAKMMAHRFGRVSKDSWRNMEVRKDILLKNFKKMPGRVMFPSTHDIIETPPFKETCFNVMEKLFKSNNHVLITTKPRLGIIHEIDRQFSSFKEQIQFRFTITSVDDQLLSFWEPNAPQFEERLASLRYSFKKGYRTSVSIEPFLDSNPSELVERIMPYTTESIWIGKMNYISSRNLSRKEEFHYDRVRKNYKTNHLRLVCRMLRGNSKIRFKDSIRNQLRINAL